MCVCVCVCWGSGVKVSANVIEHANAGNASNLQSIGLGGNDIHDVGAIHLANALKVNTKLRSLGLGGNQISK